MDGTIYDDRTAPLFAFDGMTEPAHEPHVERPARDRVGAGGIAVIANPRSHRIKHRPLSVPDGVVLAQPRTRPELRQTLADFARDGVRLLIVAGGDGTVRDVLTCGDNLWGEHRPDFGVLPCGKTNALAIDLGVPDDWTIADLVAAWRDGQTTTRSPIEIARPDEDRSEKHGRVLGFLFGAGAFVDATELAQTTHRFGAVNNLAVAMSILAAIASTIFGKADSRWRRGKRIALGFSETEGAMPCRDATRFIMVATTMRSVPMTGKGLAGTGPGIKTLVVDAPPVRIVRNFVKFVRGAYGPAMQRDGLYRVDVREIAVDLEGGFILDGERFPGGSYALCEGAPITFVSG